jgi:hypothetical protein
MSEPELICPKCKGGMEEGYILDLGHSGYRQIASWISGPPEKGGWLGLKIKDRQQLMLRTFRCTACGYLESYAK